VRFNRHIYSLGPLEIDTKTGEDEPDQPAGYSSTPYFDFSPRTDAEYLHEQAVSDHRKSKPLERTQVELTPNQLLICRHMVRGYSLQIKKWCEFKLPCKLSCRTDHANARAVDFHVDSVEDIRWNATAFESLALPGDYKHVLLAFAKSQSTSAAKFDDVIAGKGACISTSIPNEMRLTSMFRKRDGCASGRVTGRRENIDR
jgi:hypothetical protein